MTLSRPFFVKIRSTADHGHVSEHLRVLWVSRCKPPQVYLPARASFYRQGIFPATVDTRPENFSPASPIILARVFVYSPHHMSQLRPATRPRLRNHLRNTPLASPRFTVHISPVFSAHVSFTWLRRHMALSPRHLLASALIRYCA